MARQALAIQPPELQTIKVDRYRVVVQWPVRTLRRSSRAARKLQAGRRPTFVPPLTRPWTVGFEVRVVERNAGRPGGPGGRETPGAGIPRKHRWVRVPVHFDV